MRERRMECGPNVKEDEMDLRARTAFYIKKDLLSAFQISSILVQVQSVSVTVRWCPSRISSYVSLQLVSPLRPLRTVSRSAKILQEVIVMVSWHVQI